MIRFRYQNWHLIIIGFLCCPVVSLGMVEAMGPEGINACAVHEEGITGEGVNIALLSKGNVRARHAAFERSGESAVSLYDFTDNAGLSWSNHDTHLAGILISSGSPSHPSAIGVAPGATIHSGRISGGQLQARYLQKALDTLIQQQNCRIIITGIQLTGSGVTPDGGSYWTQLYDYYAETYDVIFVNASGNNRPHITIFGDAYNGITTAGLVKDNEGRYRKAGRSSNSGPTVDGRRKPELAAPTASLSVPTSRGDDLWKVVDPNGRGLTSYAIPFTAGTAALLLETAGKTAVADDDHSEVIKAVMVNSTFVDLLDKNANSSYSRNTVSVWDADYGYGRLDALRAYRTLSGGRLFQDKPSKQQTGWAYDTIGSHSEHEYRLAGRKGQRLVTTVTWHRKLTKLSSVRFLETTPFRLHLKIISPSGKMVLFEIPDKNNLVKADHQLSENGEYNIVLQNPTLTDGRDYSMAFELVDFSS